MSIMIFPEGTRSPDGGLLPFKLGAFELARSTGAPILPIAIRGTRSCRPKGSKWFGKATAVARVLPPIETQGTSLTSQALADRARKQISEALGYSPSSAQSEARSL